jgi:hypothetical protein|tara:strand:+ start:4251 stop:4562 length:312 start_codon:yes stop_codon:yes gene_type:complete
MFALIYIAISIFLFYRAIRLMSGGFKAVEEISKPVVEKRQVTRAIHPEMADVKHGDELMVVNFTQAPTDPMLQSLKDRLDNGPQFDDPWDDDEGDGDIPAVIK